MRTPIAKTSTWLAALALPLQPLRSAPPRPRHDTLRSRILRRVSGAAFMLGLAAFVPSVASAESGVMLNIPSLMKNIGATTFDTEGQAVGQSSLEIEHAEDGSQKLKISLHIAGGGSNISQATLAPIEAGLHGGTAGVIAGDILESHDTVVDAGMITGTIPSETNNSTPQSFRVIEERSQARSAEGRTFPLLVIDHQQKRVSCYPDGTSDADANAQHVEIPDGDRVVNVPMQLLFQPLAQGEVDSVRFQIATCADGPVLYEMIAVRAGTIEKNGRRIVEIEYGPDFGETIAWFASRLLPSFSFWFDAEDGSYLGHRMPLHRKGPEVTLVRQGLTPVQIGIE